MVETSETTFALRTSSPQCGPAVEWLSCLVPLAYPCGADRPSRCQPNQALQQTAAAVVVPIGSERNFDPADATLRCDTELRKLHFRKLRVQKLLLLRCKQMRGVTVCA